MAFVSEKFFVSMTLRDSGVDTTIKTYQLQSADLAAALTDAAAFVAVFKTLTDAKVDGYSVTQAFAEDTKEAIANDTIRNSMQAVISVVLATSPTKRGKIVIPAPKSALFTATTGAGSDVVNNLATLVLNCVEEFKSGGDVYLSDGEMAAAIPDIIGHRRTVYRKLA